MSLVFRAMLRVPTRTNQGAPEPVSRRRCHGARVADRPRMAEPYEPCDSSVVAATTATGVTACRSGSRARWQRRRDTAWSQLSRKTVHSWRCSLLPSGYHTRSSSDSSTAAERGGAADLGGEIATHSRTSQSVSAATLGHWRKKCCIVSYVLAAERAGDEHHTQSAARRGLTRARNMPEHRAMCRMRQPIARKSRGRRQEARRSQAPYTHTHMQFAYACVYV